MTSSWYGGMIKNINAQWNVITIPIINCLLQSYLKGPINY